MTTNCLQWWKKAVNSSRSNRRKGNCWWHFLVETALKNWCSNLYGNFLSDVSRLLCHATCEDFEIVNTSKLWIKKSLAIFAASSLWLAPPAPINLIINVLFWNNAKWTAKVVIGSIDRHKWIFCKSSTQIVIKTPNFTMAIATRHSKVHKPFDSPLNPESIRTYNKSVSMTCCTHTIVVQIE